MPSSYKKEYAVDFNGDGHINLWDPVDAIGSVAEYYKSWLGERRYGCGAGGEWSGAGLANGFKTKIQPSLSLPPQATPSLVIIREASLLRLDIVRDTSTGTACRTIHHYPVPTTARIMRWRFGSWAGGSAGAGIVRLGRAPPRYYYGFWARFSACKLRISSLIVPDYIPRHPRPKDNLTAVAGSK